MSIWGKVVGGIAGFALGGPIGALLGAVAGHTVDQMRGGTAAPSPDGMAQRQMAFTIAVIVLGAKMAKADGHVDPAEVAAFKEIFHIPRGEMGDVGQLFNEAKKDAHGFEPYAHQIADMFAHDPAVLEELLGGLFHIAKADGEVHAAELAYLRQVAQIFGFDGRTFERLRASHVDPAAEADPYAVLGLSRDADNVQVRSTYRRLIKENHPDVLMAKGMPQEFIDVANEKMAHINAAYDRVAKQRGLK